MDKKTESSKKEIAQKRQEAIWENLEKLVLMSRRPFQEVLAKFLDCAPTEEAIHEHANKYPDKWAQAISIFGKLCGYVEGPMIETQNVYIEITQLSDVELEDRVRKLHGELFGEDVSRKHQIIDVVDVDPEGSFDDVDVVKQGT